MSENVQTVTKPVVDATTEKAMVELLSNLFSSVAYMDPETVHHNLEMACENGMSKSDRSIRAEFANYCINHYALIFIGLVVNKDFREMFAEAVSVEIALDTKSEDNIAKIRKSMLDGKNHPSKGNFVLDFSRFNDAIYRKINGKLAASFDCIKEFGDTLDDFIEKLSDTDKMDIGFCISNFMYLIRAFAKNQLFDDYIETVISSVQEQLSVA